MKAHENIKALEDTLHLFETGIFPIKNESLESYLEKRKRCQVFLPKDLEYLKAQATNMLAETSGICEITCEDADTLTMVSRIYEERQTDKLKTSKVLALNFANPYSPGGGARRGANAQEEDLCRRSSLLLSLESETAKAYYQYNWQHRATDFMAMITEWIR